MLFYSCSFNLFLTMIFGILMKKRHLEILLDNLKPHPKPKAHLEQYSIEGNLASEFLLFAKEDIDGSFVIDLGCGSGRLIIGSKVLGAERAVGIDIDEETIDTAKENLKNLNGDSNSDLKVDFLNSDVKNIDKKYFEDNFSDFNGLKKVVIQNPPFGSQKKYADRIFLDKAFEIGDVIYTIHNTATRDFLINYVKEKGREITNIFQADFRIPAIYEFHKKKAVNVPVDIYRIV